MKKASLIGFTVFFMMVGQVFGDWGWPPNGGTVIVPQNPTSHDVVSITLWGEWGDSCIPNASAISVVGNDIYFDVIQNYPPDIMCFQVLTPWGLTESVGPLSPGIYAVYASLNGGSYTWMTDFIVTDKQFVLSTQSLTVPEGGTTIFTVALLNDPYETVQATVAKQSGDPDIVVQSGASLTFDSSNYSTPQTVTLAAAEDEDYFDGITIISVSAPDYLPAEVTATEADNDMPPVLYVDSDAIGSNDGRTWADAFTDLQDALSVAASYPEVEEIRVAQGVYKPAEPSGNRHVMFQLVAGVALKGGYAGFGEPDPDARNIGKHKTILSGDLNGNDGPNFANTSDNSYTVVKGSNNAVLNGFTVTGGCDGTHAGGIHNGSKNTTIINCIIKYNRSAYGGGLYNYGGHPTMLNCIFIGNQAKPNTIGCGGAIYSVSNGGSTLTNCTFIGNSANENGGGVYSSYGSTPTLTNCIFWGNYDSGGTDESAQIHGNSPIVNYCCIQGWTGALGGIGNIDADPLFADAANGDYHLKSQAGRWEPVSESWVDDEVTSPCIDAGNPGCPVGDEPAPNGNRINMGAYGGTAEASKSPANWALLADLTNDGIVDFVDLAVFFDYWPDSGQCIPADLNRSGSVDSLDYSILANQWPDAIVAEPQIQYEIAPCGMGAAGFFAAEESLETRFTVTVEGQYIHFEDMMRANCCATALWLEMTVEDNLITIYEGEYATFPCFCICDYPVTATLGPFEEGTYLLEVYEDWGGFIGSTIVIIGPGG